MEVFVDPSINDQIVLALTSAVSSNLHLSFHLSHINALRWIIALFISSIKLSKIMHATFRQHSSLTWQPEQPDANRKKVELIGIKHWIYALTKRALASVNTKNRSHYWKYAWFQCKEVLLIHDVHLQHFRFRWMWADVCKVLTRENELLSRVLLIKITRVYHLVFL